MIQYNVTSPILNASESWALEVSMYACVYMCASFFTFVSFLFLLGLFCGCLFLFLLPSSLVASCCRWYNNKMLVRCLCYTHRISFCWIFCRPFSIFLLAMCLCVCVFVIMLSILFALFLFFEILFIYGISLLLCCLILYAVANNVDYV